MKCEQCGSELEQGASFCGKCGSAAVKPEEKNNDVNRHNSWHAWLCVIVGILLLYYIIGLYFLDARKLGDHCGSPFSYDTVTLAWCMIWRMYEVAIAVIVLSCIQLRIWYKNKKNGTLKVSLVTRFAGFFAIVSAYGGLVGTIGWWLEGSNSYPAGLYVAFGLYCAGCVMTVVCGNITLFTRGSEKKKRILSFVRNLREKLTFGRKKNQQ